MGKVKKLKPVKIGTYHCYKGGPGDPNQESVRFYGWVFEKDGGHSYAMEEGLELKLFEAPLSVGWTPQELMNLADKKWKLNEAKKPKFVEKDKTFLGYGKNEAVAKKLDHSAHTKVSNDVTQVTNILSEFLYKLKEGGWATVQEGPHLTWVEDAPNNKIKFRIDFDIALAGAKAEPVTFDTEAYLKGEKWKAFKEAKTVGEFEGIASELFAEQMDKTAEKANPKPLTLKNQKTFDGFMKKVVQGQPPGTDYGTWINKGLDSVFDGDAKPPDYTVNFGDLPFNVELTEEGQKILDKVKAASQEIGLAPGIPLGEALTVKAFKLNGSAASKTEEGDDKPPDEGLPF